MTNVPHHAPKPASARGFDHALRHYSAVPVHAQPARYHLILHQIHSSVLFKNLILPIFLFSSNSSTPTQPPKHIITAIMTEWTKDKYNKAYNDYMPWVEDKVLGYWGENKTSYTAKGISELSSPLVSPLPSPSVPVIPRIPPTSTPAYTSNYLTNTSNPSRQTLHRHHRRQKH